MKKNVKKHTDGVWYYAVVRWDGYGVFTSWDPVDETIELSGYQKQLERRDELKELIDKMTKEVSLIEQEIKMMMGNAEKAKADNYRISWKASQRTDLDRKRIKAEEPEIYDRFKRTSISRRFIVSAA